MILQIGIKFTLDGHPAPGTTVGVSIEFQIWDSDTKVFSTNYHDPIIKVGTTDSSGNSGNPTINSQ